MPGKITRSARCRRHDDERMKIFTKTLAKVVPGPTISVEDVLLSDALWNSTKSIREEVLKTYFINGLNDGTLDPVKFGQYVVQDGVYCYESKVNLDVAASRCSREMREFFMEESVSYEKYYKAILEEFCIGDPKGVHLNSACQAYVDYEARVAEKRHPIYFIVASIPCARLWPWIGELFKQSGKSSGLYQEWVDENFDPTNKTYLKLEEFVNNSPDIDTDTSEEIYIECMKGELAFFNSIKANLTA